MEFPAQRFYQNDTTFIDTFRAILIEYEKYLAAILFDGDLSRILYASNTFCYYRRAGMQNYTVDVLRLPFCNYYRGNPYMQLDDEPFKKNIPAMLNEGLYLRDSLKETIKLLPVMGTLDNTLHFGRDDDATAAYERLMWMKENFRRSFIYTLLINGQVTEAPVSFVIKELNFNPDFNERDWLEKKRIIPITFQVEWRSFLIRPPVNGSGIVYLTEEVITHFFLTKNLEMPDMTITATELISNYFSDEPFLNVRITSITPSAYSATLQWDYDVFSGIDLPEPTKVVLFLNNGWMKELTPAEWEMKTFTFTNLEPLSTYEAKIRVHFLTKRYSEAKQSFTTIEDPMNRKDLKGDINTIVGMEF